MNDGTPSGPPKKRNAAIVAVAAVAAIAGFAAVYGTLGRPDNTGVSSPEAAAPSAETRKRVPGLPAFVFKTAPEPLADVTFNDASGAAKTLKDFHGKTILLNLWATWCAPCVKEMPLLEALAGEERRLKVLTASQDLGAPEKVLTYFEKEKFQRIEPWLDKEGALGFHFGGGLPVSVLYDAEGKEVWRVTGDLDWADPQVRGAIGEALPAA